MRVVGWATLGLLAGCPESTRTSEPVLDGAAVVRVRALGPVPAPHVHVDGAAVPVSWETTDTAIVTVDGMDVHAVGSGEATLVGEWQGHSLTWTAVVALPVAIRFAAAPEHIAVGASFELSIVVDGSVDGVEWSSSDPSIASVSDDGQVTGVAVGMTYISAQAGAAAAMVEVVVVP